MKNDKDKTEIGPGERELKSSQRRSLFKRRESNSAQGRKRELQTADRILLLMQEEEKY
jgi:hypothetical protein